MKYILLAPHYEKCAYFNGHNNDSSPWCLPETRFLHRDSLGRKNERTTTTFLVFKCGDPSCEAQMAMPEYDAMKTLGLYRGEGRNIGAPKHKSAPAVQGEGK